MVRRRIRCDDGIVWDEIFLVELVVVAAAMLQLRRIP